MKHWLIESDTFVNKIFEDKMEIVIWKSYLLFSRNSCCIELNSKYTKNNSRK